MLDILLLNNKFVISTKKNLMTIPKYNPKIETSIDNPNRILILTHGCAYFF